MSGLFRLGRRGLLTTAGAAVLGGCATLDFLNPPAQRIFELTPKSSFPPDLPDTHASLVVDTPTAAGGLNTARIAVRPLPTSIDYYAEVTWVDVIPIMVRTLVVETLENTGKIDVFNRSDFGSRADFALIVHVREFQAEVQQQSPYPLAHVRLQFRLLRLPQRISIDSSFVDFRVPAASNSIEDVVAAHDDALGAGLKDLAVWVVRTVAANAEPPAERPRRS
ncbi:MAG TPA: ABC-type transport auxiliary lipoprotein family protein [Geminicoccus sp.]|jgi:cholesterol transport system auxiliary component|uniref:ABC-type transport auxiliary lipoprotein family protein n=1 Tax=Geminicoccus sp. TaxID=2024832 RepID=UPI002E380BCF|nr:ABC-type transport auxiliary lipoprotein family protein [Geminicoccus sp.]HEX2526243.1 ABC-type transport auxiliary lipoprotein family protein [Geminicoccus sp.]